MRSLILIALLLLLVGGIFNVFAVGAGAVLLAQKVIGVLSIGFSLYLMVRLLKP
ncbi:MAG: hypothetical protein M1335_00160 [Chloroflexi bacterium]|nr:hypothetical protein [Chloroflexota bacterium]